MADAMDENPSSTPPHGSQQNYHPLLPTDTALGYDYAYGTVESLAPRRSKKLGDESNDYCCFCWRLARLLRGLCAGAIALFALFVMFLLPSLLILTGSLCISSPAWCLASVGVAGGVAEAIVGSMLLGICLLYCCTSADPSTFVFRVGIAVFECTKTGTTNQANFYRKRAVDMLPGGESLSSPLLPTEDVPGHKHSF